MITKPRTGPLPMLDEDALQRASEARIFSAMRYLDDVSSSLPGCSAQYLKSLVMQEYAMTEKEAADVYAQWLKTSKDKTK